MIELAIANALIISGLYWAAKFQWREDGNRAINYKKAKESDVDDDSKMILWRVRFYALKWLGEYWSKPVITCPICMASLHSTYFYFYFRPVDWSVSYWYIYALHILMVAGIGAFIVQFEKD